MTYMYAINTLSSTVTQHIVTLTHPILIFDTDVSSFCNERFHCVYVASFRCHMQGSPLTRGNKLLTTMYGSLMDIPCKQLCKFGAQVFVYTLQLMVRSFFQTEKLKMPSLANARQRGYSNANMHH